MTKKRRSAMSPSRASIPVPLLVAGVVAAVVGLAIFTAHESTRPRDHAESAEELRRFRELPSALDAVYRENGQAGTALRQAIEHARRAVVRARVITHSALDRGTTVMSRSTGSGFVIADGELLVISAHQGRPGFLEHPERTRVEFATPDGQAFVATLIDFEDGEEDWALCRIHNPFEMQLDAIELGVGGDDELVAAMGYPETRHADHSAQVGLEPEGTRPVLAGVSQGGVWPAARAIAAVARRQGRASPREAVVLVSPPQMSGMSGGPVIDRSGRAIAVTTGGRMDDVRLVNTHEGTRAAAALKLQFTPSSALRNAINAASRPRSPSQRLIDRILAVLRGYFDPRTSPAEFGLTSDERAALWLPESDEDAEDALAKAMPDHAGEFSITVSQFQAHRWHAARLRDLANLGPGAMKTFRDELDRTVEREASSTFGMWELEYLLSACKKTGTTVGLASLRPLGESASEAWRRSYVGYLSTIADDPRRALRIVFSIAESDAEEAVRAAARVALAGMLDRRAEIAVGMAVDDPTRATASDDADTRIDAVCVLARDNGDGSHGYIERLAASDADPVVRTAARHFLDTRR